MQTVTHRLFLTMIFMLGLGIAPTQGRAANRILELIAPAELGQSSFYTDVIVSYETEAEGELIVSIKDPAKEWRVLATANVRAFAGQHSEKIFVLFQETLPISDTYVVEAKLLDRSGHEQAATLQRLRIRSENIPSASRVINIDMPSVSGVTFGKSNSSMLPVHLSPIKVRRWKWPIQA